MDNKKYGIDLTEGNIAALVIRFAWPFLVAGIINALYGAADLFVISFFSTQEVISGVSTGTQVLQTVFTFTMGIGTGGTVLVGRRFGERDKEGCARATGTFFMVSLIMAIVLTIGVVATMQPVLTLMRTPDGARSSAVNYVIFAAIGVPFAVGFNAISSIVRGLGNSTIPSVIGAIGAIVNIGLDFLLVGPMGMAKAGTAEIGVAIATAASQFVTFALIGLWLLKNKFPFPFSKRHFKFHMPSFTNIFRVGIPLWLQEILVHISFMIITTIVNNMGIVAGASVGLISKVFTLAGMAPMAMSNAIAAMVAQNLGAGRRDRAMKALRYGIMYSLGIEIVMLALCQIAPETITAFFASGKQEVIVGAAAYLRSFSIDLVLISFVFNFNAYLSGCGQSSVSMIHSMVATFAVRVPLSLLLTRGIEDVNVGLLRLGFASPLATLVSIAICVGYLVHYERKVKNGPLAASQ